MLNVSTTASNGAQLKERLPVIADADKWDRTETHEPNSWRKSFEASSVKIAMKIYVVVAGPSQMHRCDENAGLAQWRLRLICNEELPGVRVPHPAPKFACLLHLNKLVEDYLSPVVADTVRHSCKEVVG